MTNHEQQGHIIILLIASTLPEVKLRKQQLTQIREDCNSQDQVS